MDTAPEFHRRHDRRTPTASYFNPPQQQPPIPANYNTMEPASARDSISLSEKRPLSPERSTGSIVTSNNEGDLSRQESLQSLKSNDTQDSSNTGVVDDGPEGSDQEENGSSYRPQKKKKSQRFFCTDYPPCNLSFTRSEHLARHIRKHTGERPFQCHCLRRFSRLDNLRQHAQTVHVNEDIPMDSLAATGTRFQRQIRTERMRTPGHRQRASTLSSGGPNRGHSRNLSGSSIGSVSDFSSPDDVRRRPQPLAMATPVQSRHGLSVDTSTANMSPPYGLYSPSGYSTPMSALSAEGASPRMPSLLASPIAMMPRTAIGWGGQNHSRRLSVPSGTSPYHGHQHFTPAQAPFMSPIMPSAIPNVTNTVPVPMSPPRESGQHDRQLSIDAMEADLRRRTWHPSSRNSFGSRPATSGLSYQQRPDDPQAVPTTQPAAQQAVRLPGIDSFDRSSLHSSSSARRMPEGMDVEEMSLPGETDISSKRNSWNSMNQNLTLLELSPNTAPREVATWRHSTGSNSQIMARPVTAPHPGLAPAPHVPPPTKGANIDDLIDPNLEQPQTPHKNKRQAMLVDATPLSPSAGEPGPAIRTSPDGSINSEEVHTPSATADYRPAIVHSDGHVERQSVAGLEDPQKSQLPSQSKATQYTVPGVSASKDKTVQPRGHDTQRLDALVAVATSEDQAIAQH